MGVLRANGNIAYNEGGQDGPLVYSIPHEVKPGTDEYEELMNLWFEGDKLKRAKALHAAAKAKQAAEAAAQ